MKKEPSARVRIGIAGAGIAGRRHGEAFARHPDAAVAAVADVDPARGREAASLFGARCFADYRGMLRAASSAQARWSACGRLTTTASMPARSISR